MNSIFGAIFSAANVIIILTVGAPFLCFLCFLAYENCRENYRKCQVEIRTSGKTVDVYETLRERLKEIGYVDDAVCYRVGDEIVFRANMICEKERLPEIERLGEVKVGKWNIGAALRGK